MAALAGVADAMDYRPREIIAMAKARDEAMWAHTSQICATMANILRDPKKPPIRPDDLNPYAIERKIPQYRKRLEEFNRRNSNG